MTDEMKLATTFVAARLTVEGMPEALAKAFTRCVELGLWPEVHGMRDGDGSASFRVFVPEKVWLKLQYQLERLGCHIPRMDTVLLPCPVPEELEVQKYFRLAQKWASGNEPLKGIEKVFPIRSGPSLEKFLGVEPWSDPPDKPGTFRLEIGPHNNSMTNIPMIQLCQMKWHFIASADHIEEKRFVFAAHTNGGVYSIRAGRYWADEFGEAPAPAQGCILPCFVVGMYCPRTRDGSLFRVPNE